MCGAWASGAWRFWAPWGDSWPGWLLSGCCFSYSPTRYFILAWWIYRSRRFFAGLTTCASRTLDHFTKCGSCGLFSCPFTGSFVGFVGFLGTFCSLFGFFLYRSFFLEETSLTRLTWLHTSSDALGHIISVSTHFSIFPSKSQESKCKPNIQIFNCPHHIFNVTL